MKRRSLSFLKIWGCDAYVKRQVTGKLAAKSDKCFFVGYPKETKGYNFYNQFENKVFVACNGHFLEREFVSKGTSGSTIQLEKVREPQTSIEPMIYVQSDSQLVTEPKPLTEGPCKSGRIRHELERYGFLVTDNRDVMLIEQDEPTSY